MFAVPVILLDSKSKFSRSNWAPSIHKCIVWFIFDDYFVKAIEDGLHIHYPDISLKFDKSHHFLFMLKKTLLG